MTKYQPPTKTFNMRECLQVRRDWDQAAVHRQRDALGEWCDVHQYDSPNDDDEDPDGLMIHRFDHAEAYIKDQLKKHSVYRPTFYHGATAGTYLDIVIHVEFVTSCINRRNERDAEHWRIMGDPVLRAEYWKSRGLGDPAVTVLKQAQATKK